MNRKNSVPGCKNLTNKLISPEKCEKYSMPKQTRCIPAFGNKLKVW